MYFFTFPTLVSLKCMLLTEILIIRNAPSPLCISFYCDRFRANFVKFVQNFQINRINFATERLITDKNTFNFSPCLMSCETRNEWVDWLDMAVELAVATLKEWTVVELEVETHLVNGDLLVHVGAVWTSGQTSYSPQRTTTKLVFKTFNISS